MSKGSFSAARSGSGQLLRDTAAQNIMSKNGVKTGFGNQSTKTGASVATQNKHTAVISYDELERIRQQCTIGNLSQYEQDMKTKERLNLQDKSKARVQNWPNTIQALRKKRDDERIRRLEEEEIERRKIDAIEYEITVQARQQAIERANKTMHDQQDMVKAFHSKMLMCDTMQEREVQLQLRKRKAEIEKQIQRQWEELEKMKMEEYDDKMRQKLLEEYEKKMENQKIINDQLHQFKMTMIKRIQDEMLEGQLIKRQVEEDLEKERQKEMERKMKQVQQADQFKRSNQELVQFQEELRKKELEEQKKIEIYAQKRDQMEQLRKDKEEQKFIEKQETRQKLIDRQAEILRSMKNREDEILNKQVAEAEEKAIRLYEEKEMRRLQMKDAIEWSRQQQIDRRNQEKAADYQEQKEFTEFWKIRNEELALAEQQEKEEERLRGEEMRNFHKRQMDVKQRKLEVQYKQELDEATRAQALLDQNEKNFYSYAEQAVKEWQDSGKSVKPLILELKNYKKQTVL